ncbi:uncharacterized protein MYCFIDRAFT_172587 [Pseudocercospora fijiensis CIRAD86]|uniref:Uncharacterized protein n=1 Tax=Pseudocercospora fijiensis (strain CIRAD86) TaxID=383855 RepID=M3BCK0_PSEFD|nr:uncharacterized protein MYCFIDRAFT_172587 [Pseudocercospora fijiensis CIRAD86]EME86893.1 hypothetical protein MYCFIDRAFT_172587 [Pseudocercospora fijiensis CIRAD86]
MASRVMVLPQNKKFSLSNVDRQDWVSSLIQGMYHLEFRHPSHDLHAFNIRDFDGKIVCGSSHQHIRSFCVHVGYQKQMMVVS